jgi:hypothetical protein
MNQPTIPHGSSLSSGKLEFLAQQAAQTSPLAAASVASAAP